MKQKTAAATVTNGPGTKSERPLARASNFGLVKGGFVLKPVNETLKIT
jgi:hypothetical protein